MVTFLFSLKIFSEIFITVGSSKKKAKHAAAQNALNILLGVTPNVKVEEKEEVEV